MQVLISNELFTRFSHDGFAWQGLESEGSESESEDDGALPVGHESLEDNEELRMHILGLNSCYCQFLVRLRICMT